MAEVEAGMVIENPVTGERGIVLEAPKDNPQRRLVVELHVTPGGAVAGEHVHPEIVETFEVLEGELEVSLDRELRTLEPGERIEVPAGSWHDWRNASSRRAIVRVEVTPGDRFVQMIRTIFGLGLDGKTDDKGMPSLPAAARDRGRVQGRDRLSQAAACGSETGRGRARADRPPARLSRDLPPLRGDEIDGHPGTGALGGTPDTLLRPRAGSAWVKNAAPRALAPLALMGVIFYLSAQEAVGPSLPEWMRWIAHFSEYAALTALWIWALRPELGHRAVWVAIAISFAYAISDEIHQSFVEGRDSDPVDVIVDSLGIGVSALACRRWLARQRL